MKKIVNIFSSIFSFPFRGFKKYTGDWVEVYDNYIIIIFYLVGVIITAAFIGNNFWDKNIISNLVLLTISSFVHYVFVKSESGLMNFFSFFTMTTILFEVVWFVDYLIAIAP